LLLISHNPADMERPLGNAFRFSLQGGEAMSSEEFAAAGGNESAAHMDFMVGSDKLAVDGILTDGSAEAIMRQGEWTFGT
jgi:aminopeptidase